MEHAVFLYNDHIHDISLFFFICTYVETLGINVPALLIRVINSINRPIHNSNTNYKDERIANVTTAVE